MIRDLLADPDSFRVVTQPILDLVSGEIMGYEALSRFGRPIGRRPNEWFALARSCGLGAELEAAAVDAALSIPDRPEGTWLTVNVSPSTLGTRALGDVLPGDLSGLIFELTENEPIADDPTLASTIARYRRRGAHFALDDLGAGYAQLANLDVVDPDLIKLDRGLLEGVDRDPSRAAAIEDLIHAAMKTGATVCAEGAETVQQLRWLYRAGVTCVQGYLTGRPQPGWAGETHALTGIVRQVKTPSLFDRHDGSRPRRQPTRWTAREFERRYVSRN